MKPTPRPTIKIEKIESLTAYYLCESELNPGKNWQDLKDEALLKFQDHKNPLHRIYHQLIQFADHRLQIVPQVEFRRQMDRLKKSEKLETFQEYLDYSYDAYKIEDCTDDDSDDEISTLLARKTFFENYRSFKTPFQSEFSNSMTQLNKENLELKAKLQIALTEIDELKNEMEKKREELKKMNQEVGQLKCTIDQRNLCIKYRDKELDELRWIKRKREEKSQFSQITTQNQQFNANNSTQDLKKGNYETMGGWPKIRATTAIPSLVPSKVQKLQQDENSKCFPGTFFKFRPTHTQTTQQLQKSPSNNFNNGIFKSDPIINYSNASKQTNSSPINCSTTKLKENGNGLNYDLSLWWCNFCQNEGDHASTHCPINPDQISRFIKIMELNLCMNCLSKDHYYEKCVSINCKICQCKHFTGLCNKFFENPKIKF